MSAYRFSTLPLSNVVQKFSTTGYLPTTFRHIHTAQYLNPQSSFITKAVWICTAKENSGSNNVIVKPYGVSSIPRSAQTGKKYKAGK